MGYWENTTYVQHGNVSEVADAMVTLFGKDGMQRVTRPAQRERPLKSPMQYRSAAENDLWAVAIAPGEENWCIIKTAPMELLAERRQGERRMRLADLCVALSATAVQVHVYDSWGIVLVEVSAEGEVLVSGFDPDPRGEDMFDWNGERLSEELLNPQFRLHPFQDLVASELANPFEGSVSAEVLNPFEGHVRGGGKLGDEFAKIVGDRLGGSNAAYRDNLIIVENLISHKPLPTPDALDLYFQRAASSITPAN